MNNFFKRPVGAAVLFLNDFHHGKRLNDLNRCARLVPDDVKGMASMLSATNSAWRQGRANIESGAGSGTARSSSYPTTSAYETAIQQERKSIGMPREMTQYEPLFVPLSQKALGLDDLWLKTR